MSQPNSPYAFDYKMGCDRNGMHAYDVPSQTCRICGTKPVPEMNSEIKAILDRAIDDFVHRLADAIDAAAAKEASRAVESE